VLYYIKWKDEIRRTETELTNLYFRLTMAYKQRPPRVLNRRSSQVLPTDEGADSDSSSSDDNHTIQSNSTATSK
jgi:hypothetical protein